MSLYCIYLFVIFQISPDSSFRIYSPNQTFNNNNNNNSNSDNSFINNNNNNNDSRFNKKPIWNSSTRLQRMDPLLTKEVSMDVFSLTREIHTPIPSQISTPTERALLEDAEKTKNLLCKRNEPLPDIKIYNLWSRHLSKDQVCFCFRELLKTVSPT